MTRLRRIRRFVWGRRRDERGATFIFTAISMVALLGAGAMGVDVGFSVYGSREAQAMADTGALDMARYINIADVQAQPATATCTGSSPTSRPTTPPTRTSPSRPACG